MVFAMAAGFKPSEMHCSVHSNMVYTIKKQTLPGPDIYALHLIPVVIQNIHPHFRFTAHFKGQHSPMF